VVDYSKIDEPDAACFVEWDDVASGATECSIVTSTVPEDVPIEERHRYESRYAALNEAVERLREKPGQTVSLRRVNSDGELA
jgi:hypothetical protein